MLCLYQLRKARDVGASHPHLFLRSIISEAVIRTRSYLAAGIEPHGN